MFQRTYPFDSVPEDARRKAWESVRDRRRPRILDTTQPYWNSVGPKPSYSFFPGQGLTSGRINTVAVKPDDPNVILLGSATGGIWRSADAGATFVPVTDDQVDLAVSSIGFAPSSPSTVYAAMGDFASGYVGYGVLKSTDGGQTWSHINNSTLPAYVNTTKLAIDPTNPNRLYLAVYAYLQASPLNGSRFGGGIYVSADGGVNWTLTMPGLAKDVMVDPLNPAIVYGAMLPFGGVSTPAAGVYRSVDRGSTWKIYYASAYSPTTDIKIAITSDTTIYFYAGDSSGNTSLVGYDNGAGGGNATVQNWSLGPANLDSAQFAYNTYIAADPSNARNLYIGSRDAFKVTRNADNTLSVKNLSGNFLAADNWAKFHADTCTMHTDQHSIAFSPTNPNLVYFGNDGGLYQSPDGGNTLASLNSTLTLEQFYALTVHGTDKTFSIGGTQDNSAQRLSSDLSSWYQIVTGDSGGAVIDPVDSSTVFITLDKDVFRFKNKGQTYDAVVASPTTTFGEPSTGARVAFIPPFTGNGKDATLYYGTWRLFTSTDLGTSWTAPAGTTDLTKGSTDALNVISVSSANPNVIYTGSQQGRAMVSQNGGLTWTDITSGLPNRTITSINIDLVNPGTAYLSVSGFGTGHLFRTTNSGALWTDVSGNLPNIPASAVTEDPKNPSTVYAGTDIGIFRSTAGGNTWTAFNNGLPPVVITAFVTQASGLVRAATWGRGIYDLVVPGSTTPPDTTPPALTVTSHTNGQTVSTSSITLAGTATDSGLGNSGISSVTVNGVPANNGTATGSAVASWSLAVTLTNGANVFSVVAKDASPNQNSTTVTITINYQPSTGGGGGGGGGGPITPSGNANTYHVFPQVADGRFGDGSYYQSTLMVTNASSGSTSCTLQLHGLTVNGLSQISFTVGTFYIYITPGNTQSLQTGYASLQCSAKVEAQLVYTFYAGNGVKVSEATVFSSPSATLLRVIADYRGGSRLGLAVANDSTQSASYTLRVYDSNGIARGTSQLLTVAAGQNTAAFVEQFVTLPANFYGYVDVVATTGSASVIGLRYTGNVFTTVPAANLASTSPTANTYHVFPQVADGYNPDGSYFQSTLMVTNVSSGSLTCTLQLQGVSIGGQTQIPFTVSTVYTYVTPGKAQPLQTGYASLQCSSKVEAQLLYSFYSSNGVKASEATVFSSPPVSSARILADYRGGGRLGLAVANDSTQNAGYTIRVYDTNGNSIGSPPPLTVTADHNTAAFVEQFVTLPANYYGYVDVVATSGKGSLIGLRFTGSAFTTVPAIQLAP
jgi:hypothetical protein